MDLKKLPAYELVLQETIPDIQSEGYLLRHKKSGARVMVLENQDENKVFNIAFRTVPGDSTGVAHILEHSVLCGSQKFPSKDPFVELVKGSVNTFLNAMTYPDKTMYPVASCNDRDFANLMHVYLDAVFFPNIYQREEIFRQEGWSYQIEKPEDELIYNGVVYNEMKGAFSSPEDVLEREILSSLFPDNTYYYESGGDPEVIPELSYEEFLEFHGKYYHPSNSYIYLYGDMDFEERLNWMDREYLSQFAYHPVDSQIKLQKPFEKLQEISRKYSIAQGDTEEDNTFLAFSTVVGTSLDTKLASAFAVLEYALLEAPGAPLKEKLLDEGLGKDIMSSYDSGICQPVFSVIAKNGNVSDKERFLKVIRETLQQIVKEGISENALQAAINIMEFKFREADYGSFPKGLMYGIDVFDSWLYSDEHPFDYLKQLDDFAFLKQQVGTGYYEKLIQTWILDNPHASLVVVAPERGLTARMEEATRARLQKIKAGMSERQVQELIEKTEKLRRFQETPSTQEELQAIPMLSREDLKKEAAPFKTREENWNGIQVLYHDYPTNGIAYLNLLFDASDLEREELPYFGILKNVLGMVDTQHYGYQDLYNEINRNTGGITPGISVFPNEENKELVRAAFGVQVRTLYDKLEYCFQMIREILFTSNVEQEKRLKEIVSKLKSRTSARLNSSGSATAAVRSMSYFSPVYVLNDSISGIEFYKTLEELEKHFEEKKDYLKQQLKRVLKKVLRPQGLLLDVTADESVLKRLRPLLEGLAKETAEFAAAGVGDGSFQAVKASVPEEGKTEKKGKTEISSLNYLTGLQTEKKNEGFLTPAKVQYVARSGNFKEKGFAYTGTLRVLKVIMSYEYLWTNIRVKGGAYGCSGSFGRNGDSNFVSFRDPHLRGTNQVYEGVPAYLEQFTVEERDMTKYVIGTIGEMDTPLNPAALGRRSMNAWLCGLTEEQIQKERDQVLAASQEDIRRLAPLMQAVLDQGCICVLGNEEKLKAESELFMELKEF